MALLYKLEFVYDNSSPSDASVYIHLRNNPPIYQTQIAKEDYDIIPDAGKNPFLTGILDISGVTQLSTQAYRVWLMKSPVYNWQEVLVPALYFIASHFGETAIQDLPGSAQPDGTGLTLQSPNNRRKP